MRIVNPDPFVSQVQHKLDDGRHVFFLSNRDEEKGRMLNLEFSGLKGSPVVWDTDSGSRHPISIGNSNELSLQLDALESKVIVFEESPASQDRDESVANAEPKAADAIKWSGSWEVEFKPVTGKPFSRKYAALSDLSMKTNDKAVSSFGGTVVYRNSFSLSGQASTHPVLIDLGEANGTVSLEINGKDLGTSWYGWHRFDLGSGLKAGVNEVEITVTTVLANDMKARSNGETQKRWAWWYNEIPMGLEGPVQLYH